MDRRQFLGGVLAAPLVAKTSAVWVPQRRLIVPPVTVATSDWGDFILSNYMFHEKFDNMLISQTRLRHDPSKLILPHIWQLDAKNPDA